MDTASTVIPQSAGTEEEAYDAFSLRLQSMLESDAELPQQVVQRASVDPLFLHRLVEARNSPSELNDLIQSADGGLPKWAPRPTGTLLRQATIAITRWAAHGFTAVSEDVKEKRRAACKACPHLRAPSQHILLQVIAPGSNTCGLCSCAIEKKIMIPTESCPVADAPGSPTNRWGEPLSAIF